MTHTHVFGPEAQLRLWARFATWGGRPASRLVCGVVTAWALWIDPPYLRSARGTLLLRRRYYGEVRHRYRAPWALPCGEVLYPNTLVFELDLDSRACERARQSERNLYKLMLAEFRSLAAQVRDCPERAIVSRTTLDEQLRRLGFHSREVPPGLHRTLDSFFRQMYILAYDEHGRERVTREPPRPVVEAAVSLKKFLERFG